MSAAALSEDYLVQKLDELPALPSIVYELSQAINDPMSSTKDIEKIMSNDLSMTTKVLRLVNSAYYAIPGGVTSLSRAIGYIGFDTVNQLVLSASILKALETKGPQQFDMNEFWKHSIAVAIASETLAKRVGHPLPTDLFTCGLVHDMGKVALYSLAQEEMVRLVSHAEANKCSYFDAEDVLKIPKHTVIGQALAKKWTLPLTIQATIRHHHQVDPNLRQGLTAENNRNVDIVFLSNLLIHALKFGNSGHSKIAGAPKEVMERLTLNPETDLKPLILEIKKSLEGASDFLRVLSGN